MKPVPPPSSLACEAHADYLFGLMDEGQERLFKAHLQTCVTCQQEVQLQQSFSRLFEPPQMASSPVSENEHALLLQDAFQAEEAEEEALLETRPQSQGLTTTAPPSHGLWQGLRSFFFGEEFPWQVVGPAVALGACVLFVSLATQGPYPVTLKRPSTTKHSTTQKRTLHRREPVKTIAQTHGKPSQAIAKARKAPRKKRVSVRKPSPPSQTLALSVFTQLVVRSTPMSGFAPLEVGMKQVNFAPLQVRMRSLTPRMHMSLKEVQFRREPDTNAFLALALDPSPSRSPQKTRTPMASRKKRVDQKTTRISRASQEEDLAKSYTFSLKRGVLMKAQAVSTASALARAPRPPEALILAARRGGTYLQPGQVPRAFTPPLY